MLSQLTMNISVNDLEFYQFTITDSAGNKREINLREELAYSDTNIDREIMEQPSKYVYWASLLELLKNYQESFELQLEVIEAELDKEARDSVEGTQQKATKDYIEAYIRQQESWKKAKKTVLNQSFRVNHIARVVRAFEQRANMLQQTGASIRKEKELGRGAGQKIIND